MRRRARAAEPAAAGVVAGPKTGAARGEAAGDSGDARRELGGDSAGERPAGKLSERERMEARIAALEQLIDVHERTVAEQARGLESIVEQLAARARELKRSNEELEQFAYVASHDLQEPLRMVASYTQLLEKRYADRLDDDAREFIRYAVDGAVRMQSLINALLEYARVSTRGRAFAGVSLDAVMRGIEKDLSLRIAETNATLVWSELPVVWADEAQMRQLLQNLVVNGLKFAGEAPPRVEVSAERERGAWRIRVRDGGIGISPRYHARIFQIFQRLHGMKYEGTGIGLAVARRIVERHGGAIGVDSEAGEGATFWFTLPRPEADDDLARRGAAGSKGVSEERAE